MQNSSLNFNIFSIRNSSIEEIFKCIGDFQKLFAGVCPVKNSPGNFFSIITRQQDTFNTLNIHSDIKSIKLPLLAMPPLLFLQEIFAVSNIEKIILKAEAPEGKEIEIDRANLSVIIGYLKSMSSPQPANLEVAIKNEMTGGDLHKAHYYLYLQAKQNKFETLNIALPHLLEDLNIHQSAYDIVRKLLTVYPEHPQLFYLLSTIYMKTGDTEKALQILGKIPDTPQMSDKKDLQMGWIQLKNGNWTEAEKIFRKLLNKPFEKQQVQMGLGISLIKSGFISRNRNLLNEAFAVLNSAIQISGHLNARIFFYLGNIHFKTENLAEAENCYAKSINIAASLPVKINLCLVFIKTKRWTEAIELSKKIFLFDPVSVLAKIIPEIPKTEMDANASTLNEIVMESPPEPEVKEPVKEQTRSHEASLESARIRLEKKYEQETSKPPDIQKPLQKPPNIQKPPQKTTGIYISTGQSVQKPEIVIEDEFLARALTMQTFLEDELNKDIDFNLEGVTQLEKELRLILIKLKLGVEEKTDLILNASAFLCYTLQNQYGGTLEKSADYDPWAWDMRFEQYALVTYPIIRLWKCLKLEYVPDPGWLFRYVNYIDTVIKNADKPKHLGMDAVNLRLKSHPERIIDTETEHEKIMILVSSIDETKDIQISKAGVPVIERAIKTGFKPDLMSPDDWKLLRCYAHIFVEILKTEFKAVWYNTDGNDGVWSMYLPWDMFVFPIGKVYKSALKDESLAAYFNKLAEEKFKK